MSTTSTPKKPAATKKAVPAVANKSDATLTRKVLNLESRIEVLEDLAENRLEEQLEKLQQHRPAYAPQPIVSYYRPQQPVNALLDTVIDTLLFVTVGMAIGVAIKMLKQRSY